MTKADVFNSPVLESIHAIVFDFDGVFTDDSVYLSSNGDESVKCDRRDGLGIELLRRYISKKKLETEVFILSKEKNNVVKLRAQKLNLSCYNGIDDKFDFLNNHFAMKKKSFQGAVYVGNDVNDYFAMRRCEYSYAPKSAHELIKKIATHVVNVNGGDGLVRNIVESLLRFNEMSEGELHELICNS